MTTRTVTIDFDPTSWAAVEGAPVIRQLYAGRSDTQTGTLTGVSVLGKAVQAKDHNGALSVVQNGHAELVLELTSEMAQTGAFWKVTVGASKAIWRVYVTAGGTVAIGALQQVTTAQPPPSYPDPANFEQVAHKGHAGGYAALDDSGQVLDGNGNPLAAGTPPAITKTPAAVPEAPPGYFYYDLSDAAVGDVFDLTAVPHQGTDVVVLLTVPDPATARSFTVNWHVDTHSGPDATSFGGLFASDFSNVPDGYPSSVFGPAWDGSTAATVQLASEGDGQYIYGTVTAGEPTLNLRLAHAKGQGMLAHRITVPESLGTLEGALDRWRFCTGVATSPTFDPTPFIGAGNGPVTGLDYGTAEAGGSVAVLGNSDPAAPFVYAVDTDGSLIDDDHFPTHPGPGFRCTLLDPGGPNDGMTWMWLPNQVSLFQRAGSPLHVSDATGRWLSYPAGTPI